MSAHETFQHPRMPALVLSVIGACLGYLMAYLGVLPVLHYIPLEHTWTFSPETHDISMGYYGVLIDAALVSAVAYGVGRWPPLAHQLARPPWPIRISFFACLLLISTFIAIPVIELWMWGA